MGMLLLGHEDFADVFLRTRRIVLQQLFSLYPSAYPPETSNQQVRIDPAAFLEMRNDVDFSAALLKEESVLVLPGI